MMDLRRLMDLLPYYFKENDTYKDKDGKGILEKFLEICGGYLEDQVTSDIESLLDNLDATKCPEHFLSYLWEWFGCIPFAEGEFIDPDKWDQYYNGFDSKETYESKKNYWIHQDPNNPLVISLDTKRRILRYAITLLKCRGSRVFFETMFRFYGISVTITDGASSLSEDIPVTTPKMDDELNMFDNNLRFDEVYDCMQCIPVTFEVEYPWEYSEDDEDLKDRFNKFKSLILNFITKYIPFNARPYVKFNHDGKSIISNIYYIRVTNLQTGESQISYTGMALGSKWNWETTQGVQLILGIEVWSSLDPEGKESHWVYKEGDGDLPSNAPRYNSGDVKILSKFETVTNLNYVFYNAESLDNNDPSVCISLSLTVNYSEGNSGYEFSIEVWDTKKNEKVQIDNFSKPIDPRDKEVRIYPYYYEDLGNSQTRVLKEITVNPSEELSQVDNYYKFVPTIGGTYIIALKENPGINGKVIFNNVTNLYKVVCQKFNEGIWEDIGDDETLSIYAGMNLSVNWRVIIKPYEGNIDNYQTRLIGSSVQCITTGRTHIAYKFDDGEVGIFFSTSFAGTFTFRSLYNDSSNWNDERLQDSVTVTYKTTSSNLLQITPTSSNVELYGTENEAKSRTINFTIRALNKRLRDLNVREGNVGNVSIQALKWDETSGSYVWDSSFQSNWLGSPSVSLNWDSSNDVLTFSYTVPYKSQPSSQNPYTGLIRLTYNLPLDEDGHTYIVDGNVAVIYVNYTSDSGVVDIGELISIVPTTDTNRWEAFVNNTWTKDWSKLYPNLSGDSYTTVSQARYTKEEDSDTASFYIKVTQSSNKQDYVKYDWRDSGMNTPIGSGTVSLGDAKNPITFKDPGIYRFEKINVTVIVKDFVPDFKVSCNPNNAILDGNFDQVSTKVTLAISPDKSSFTHQIRVLKDNDSNWEEIILDASTETTFIATSKGTYRFRSVDAEGYFSGTDLSSLDALFVVGDKSSMIDHLTCEPASATINTTNGESAQTIVRIYGTDGKELRDSAFLIKMPDGTTSVSGAIFVTKNPGTYTFYSVDDPSKNCTFVVGDSGFKSNFGCVYIDPNSMKATYPYSQTISIDFTAWDATPLEGDEGNLYSRPYGDLKAQELLVQYGKTGSSDFVTIPYANPSGVRYTFYKNSGTNNYNIQIMGLTLTEDTTIRIRNASKPTTATSHDEFYINQQAVSSGLKIWFDGGSQVDIPVVPHVSPLMYVTISKSDNTAISYKEYISQNLRDHLTIKLEGKPLSYMDNGTTMNSEGYYYLVDPGNVSEGDLVATFAIKVYLTKTTSTLEVSQVIDGKTLQDSIQIKGQIDYSEIIKLMHLKNGVWEVVNSLQEYIQANPIEVKDEGGSSTTLYFTRPVIFCPGLDGVDSLGISHNKEVREDLNWGFSDLGGTSKDIYWSYYDESQDKWIDMLSTSMEYYYLTGQKRLRFRLAYGKKDATAALGTELGNHKVTLQVTEPIMDIWALNKITARLKFEQQYQSNYYFVAIPNFNLDLKYSDDALSELQLTPALTVSNGLSLAADYPREIDFDYVLESYVSGFTNNSITLELIKDISTLYIGSNIPQEFPDNAMVNVSGSHMGVTLWDCGIMNAGEIPDTNFTLEINNLVLANRININDFTSPDDSIYYDKENGTLRINITIRIQQV